METKHTKGEWILNESRSEIVSSNDCSKNGGIDIIAQCFCGFNYESSIDECRANAKLIAAAPDLLEALIEAKKELEYHNWQNTYTYNQIVNAINKATK